MISRRFLTSTVRNLVMRPKAQARHREYSMVLSADDEPGRPSPSLISLATTVVRRAQEISCADVGARLPGPPNFPEIWPGEHYRLLAALVAELKPAIVIEIGTYTGLSALAMKPYLPPSGVLHTFDIVAWDRFAETCLRPGDFEDGRLVQHVADLTDRDTMRQYAPLLAQAGLIFIDAAKDGVMEQRLLDNFRSVPFRATPLMVFDDIRLWNMLHIWRGITSPKLDLTSFGHWSGTGLVEWKV